MSIRFQRLARNSGSYYETEWYYGPIPKPIEFVGTITLPGNRLQEEDRRIITVINVRGIKALVYHDFDGFKQILIED